MQPVLNGIGGDLFAIVWDPATHQLYGYNGSGPSAASRDLEKMKAEVAAAYQKAGLPQANHIPSVGSLPITVPGAVDAWFALHEKFGKLPMTEVLAPATGYANNGFPVTELISKYWKGNMAAFERSKIIEELDNARHTYLITDDHRGHTPEQGEIFKNPDLAHTLTMIAEGGRDAYYKGDIARTIDAYFKRIGGDLSYSDFANFHGEWVTPQSVNYHGYDVYELPPNGQGFAALEMLQILKHFDLKKMGIGSADTLTTLIEAKRLAYEDLAKFYADPKFASVPMKGLISEAYGAVRAKEISSTQVNPAIGAGNPQLFNGDTIYLTTADKDGMMVSLI
jgi:gamma-glutamyltranspeptidase/glutathione hydrolase